MINRLLVLALGTSLLTPLTAAAQESGAGEKLTALQRHGATSPLTQMHEDIEIMRRLLNGKLQGFAPKTDTPLWRHATLALDNTCANCHQPNLARSLLNQAGTHEVWLSRFAAGADYPAWNQQFHNDGNLLSAYHRLATSAPPPRALDAEGVYLKGQGVIFTLTLPAPSRDPRPEAPKPAPKPPSEWERVRQELRHEKPQAEKTAKPAPVPTLGDAVLKLLADNGKHFTHLGANESLTVAVTFRPPPAATTSGLGAAFGDFDNDGKLDIYVTNAHLYAAQKQQPTKEDKPASKPQGDHAKGKRIKDLILLGELNLKQNKIDEAMKAFRQTVELKPEGEQAATAYKDLAQSLIAAQKYEEAAKALQKAVEWHKALRTAPPPKTEPGGAAQARPLPPKLVISVPKKLLDAAGDGKMRFEEFKKAASVEYLTFPAESK